MGSAVKVRSGKLVGEVRRGVHVFRGIPYAQPPRAALRWQPPQPLKPWRGVRQARRFGASAPQSPEVMLLVRRLIGVALRQQSQDCLYLNVWTPGTEASARRPVLVWIHGGAFLMGSGSTALYDGSHLAKAGDAVVVTLNYRLGALGFLNVRELSSRRAAANLGLRDQIAALEWVRDNIEAFGGDPENVTIFGESAGGMSVGTLLGTPAAHGLFRRAIAQSGAAHNVSSRVRADAVAHCFLEQLGAKRFEALEEASVSELMGAQRRTTALMGMATGSLPWQPSVDGELIPEQPLAAVAAGRGARVPLLIGTTRDEWKLFMLGDRAGRRLDASGLERRLSRVLPEGDRELVRRAVRVYRDAAGGSRARPSDLWVSFQSDRIFHHPAHSLAGLHARHLPETYAYVFDWSPPLAGRVLGACHGLDVPFVFGTQREPLLRPLVGLTPEAGRLSQRIMNAWLAFARSGDPAHESLPAWPAYREDSRDTLVLGRRPRVERDPFGAARSFWGEVDPLHREVAGDEPPAALTKRASPASRT
jgi:para-nitrobenzyl esterase